MLRPELTTAWLTVRQLLVVRRAVAVLALALLPAGLAALYSLRGPGDALPFLLQLYDTLLTRIVLPVVALVFGTGAFGAERDDGTAVYLLTRPVARWRIALSKLATAAALTFLVTTASAVLTGVVALRGFGGDAVIGGLAAGIALGSVLYAAVFVALGLVMRRAMIAGLAYVIIWEAVAADTFAGTRTLSIRQYVLSTADHFASLDPAQFAAPLPLRTALIMSGLVLAGAGLLTIRRLSAFEIIDQR
jgi:ABC-2 type transport system permease protein